MGLSGNRGNSVLGDGFRGGFGLDVPLHLGDLGIWLRASSISATDGDNLTAWPDDSGNGRDFENVSSTTFQPTYKDSITLVTASGSTVQPVVRFDDQDYMRYASNYLESAGDHTFIALVQLNTLPILSERSYSFSVPHSGNDGTASWFSSTALAHTFYGDSGANSYTDSGTFGQTTGQLYMIVLRFYPDLGAGQQFMAFANDGTSIYSQSGTNNSTHMQDASENIIVVGNDDDGGPTKGLRGDMPEFLLYDRGLTDAEIDKLEAYFDAKYNGSFADAS